jgi:dCTP diphosphatase
MNELISKYRQFVKERNWETFHNPKNLAAALSVEASELLEIFMWLNESQSQNLNPDRLEQVRDEMGDIFLYLLRLSDVLNIDLLEATQEKFAKVEKKYPISKSLELARSLWEP